MSPLADCNSSVQIGWEMWRRSGARDSRTGTAEEFHHKARLLDLWACLSAGGHHVDSLHSSP